MLDPFIKRVYQISLSEFYCLSCVTPFVRCMQTSSSTIGGWENPTPDLDCYFLCICYFLLATLLSSCFGRAFILLDFSTPYHIYVLGHDLYAFFVECIVCFIAHMPNTPYHSVSDYLDYLFLCCVYEHICGFLWDM